MEPLVQISNDGLKGRILVTTQAVFAGQVILQEQPIVISRDSRVSSTYEAFLATSETTRALILDFFSPVDGPQAAQARAVARSSLYLQTEEEIEECVKVCMAFNFNSVGVHFTPTTHDSPSTLAGLYSLACRASHSCIPNCFWFGIEDGSRVMRAMIALVPGQEVTIDYMAKGFLYQNVHQRRTKLLLDYEFHCQCPRCSADGDDTRRFPCCCSGTCTGYHLVHQPTEQDEATLNKCCVCDFEPPVMISAHLLKEEASLIAELDRIDALPESHHGTSIQSALVLHENLKPPHPHHALAARIGMLQWNFFFCIATDWKKAEKGARAAVESREAILTVPNWCKAYAYLCLGDSILEGGPEHAIRANEAYRHAVHILSLQYGPTHPSSSFASSSLATAQKLMLSNDLSKLITGLDQGCNFCGGPGLAGKALAMCGRCSQAAYCCKEHQLAQWSMHKKYCSRI